MVVEPIIWQISGYSNRGKTTLVEALIKKITAHSLKVATIKHHGHGKKLAALDTGKDSWKHRQAGAMGSAVFAAETLQIQLMNDVEWELEDLLPLYKKARLDIILIEGFKNKHYPKLVIIKEESDWVLLQELHNIEAVLVWDKQLIKNRQETIPYFLIDDIDQISKWLFGKWGV